MIERIESRLLLGPHDLQPTDARFEVVGIFNPGACQWSGEVVLLVRVAEQPRERRPGFTGLPRFDPAQGLVIDWVPSALLEEVDPRVVRFRETGRVRLTFISYLRVVYCGAGRQVRAISSHAFRPSSVLEEFGVEDPRITVLNGRCYFTYVAVSRHGPATALASTTNFQNFRRHGVIFCPENKDVVLFPESIGGRYIAIHRPVCATPFTRPEMWIARSNDLLDWGQLAPLRLAEPGNEESGVTGGESSTNIIGWQSGRVGAGAPPLRVKDGWLEIYHGNSQAMTAGQVGTYVAGAVLLATDDPSRIVRQSPDPILVPETPWETQGFIKDVIFPTGLVRDDGQLLIYAGAADTSTEVVVVSEAALLCAMG